MRRESSPVSYSWLLRRSKEMNSDGVRHPDWAARLRRRLLAELIGTRAGGEDGLMRPLTQMGDVY